MPLAEVYGKIDFKLTRLFAAYSIALLGKNIFDELLVTIFSSRTGNNAYVYGKTVSDPRLFGIDVQERFQ